MEGKNGIKASIGEVRFFNVKNCPHDTFARFHKFCEDVSKEAGLTYASYPLGIKKLLDGIEPVGSSKKEELKEEKGIKTFGGD